MKAMIEKLLAGGGYVQLEAGHDDDGKSLISAYVRYGHGSAEGESETLDAAFSLAIAKLSLGCKTAANAINEERLDLANMIREYEERR